MIYIVKRGDTLAKIASKYSTSIRAIAAQNNIKNINKIGIGQALRINESQGITPNMSFNPNPINSSPFAATGATGGWSSNTGLSINDVSMRANAKLINRYGQNSGTVRAGDNPPQDLTNLQEPSFFDKYKNYFIYGSGALVVVMLIMNSGKRSAPRRRSVKRR